MSPVLNNSVLYRMHTFCNYYMSFNVVLRRQILHLIGWLTLYGLTEYIIKFKLEHYYNTKLLPSHCAWTPAKHGHSPSLWPSPGSSIQTWWMFSMTSLATGSPHHSHNHHACKQRVIQCTHCSAVTTVITERDKTNYELWQSMGR